MSDESPIPTDITYHQRTRVLEVTFSSGERFEMSAEYLRVNSPSAEVQGHGPGTGTVPTDKEHVAIEAIEPVGHYAVRLRFDDGHDTGLYTFDELHRLGRDREVLWQAYIEYLKAAGQPRC